MTGKIRVSIVATSLGHKNDNNTVLNMVSRIHAEAQLILIIYFLKIIELKIAL